MAGGNGLAVSQSRRFSDQSSLLASWGPWPGPGSCWVLQVTLAPRPCWNWRLGRGEEDCRYQRRTSSTPAPKTSMPGWTRGRDEMLCNGSRSGTGFLRDTWPSARTTNVAAPDTTKLAALLQLQGLPRRHVRPREGRNGSARASNSPWQRGSLQLLLRDDAPPNYVPAHWWCSSRCGASKRHSTAGACLSFHPQQTHARRAQTGHTHTHTHTPHGPYGLLLLLACDAMHAPAGPRAASGACKEGERHRIAQTLTLTRTHNKERERPTE